MNHILFFCKTCRCYAIKCGNCGNNTCNGGNGKTVLDKDCDCINAYKVFDNIANLKYKKAIYE